MSRACASGALYHCTCALPPREPPRGSFKWGGCGDNVRWGSHFAQQFTDATERHGLAEVGVPGRKRDAEGAEKPETALERKMKRLQAQLAAMNLHNNRLGRRVSINFK